MTLLEIVITFRKSTCRNCRILLWFAVVHWINYVSISLTVHRPKIAQCKRWLFVPLFSSTQIYTRLQRRNNMMDRMRENKYRSSETKRINIMLFSIVVAFAVCWLPLNVFNAVIDWNHEVAMNCTHNLLFSLCHLTAMCSVCINPVFYGFLNRNFQRDLRAFRLCKIVSARENEYDMVAMSTIHTDVSKMSLKISSLDL